LNVNSHRWNRWNR